MNSSRKMLTQLVDMGKALQDKKNLPIEVEEIAEIAVANHDS